MPPPADPGDGVRSRRSSRPSVVPLVRAQLRAHWGRALALGLGVVAATSVFTVLTGASEIGQAENIIDYLGNRPHGEVHQARAIHI